MVLLGKHQTNKELESATPQTTVFFLKNCQSWKHLRRPSYFSEIEQHFFYPLLEETKNNNPKEVWPLKIICYVWPEREEAAPAIKPGPQGRKKNSVSYPRPRLFQILSSGRSSRKLHLMTPVVLKPSLLSLLHHNSPQQGEIPDSSLTSGIYLSLTGTHIGTKSCLRSLPTQTSL